MVSADQLWKITYRTDEATQEEEAEGESTGADGGFATETRDEDPPPNSQEPIQ